MQHDPRPPRWVLGFTLALTVAFLWGVLPIALKVALTQLDPWTITWWRFAGAAIVLGGWLVFRGEIPLRQLRTPGLWRWLLPSIAGLTANYVLYLLGLNRTSPTVAQTVIQIAPLLLLVFGIIVFKERFSPLQWVGFAGLVFGLLIFFNRRLPELLHPESGWSLGIFMLISGAVGWAIYGIGQKQLLRQLGASQVLFLIYVSSTLILWPMARPATVLGIDRTGLAALLFCVANTIIAYGAFAMALDVWDVSRVSSILAAAPLFTLAGSALAASSAVAWIQPEALNSLSVAGALCVVAGSIVAALGNTAQRRSRGRAA